VPRKLFILATIFVGLGLAAFWLLTIPATISASALPSYTPNLNHGRTMFFVGGCATCHATTKDDPTKLGGGLALITPFGTFYPPNISPNPDDGIGGWTEAQFVTAMVKGSAPNGRHYYPAFPIFSYQRMSLHDVRDLFAYLKSLPAVQGKVREHDIPIIFQLRRTLGLWKLFFLDGMAFKPDPTQSAEWNRGAYLVNGPGHCAECHSPRNILGGIMQSQNFTGALNLEGEGFVPNITQSGLKDWSVQDIAEMFETGDTPKDSVGGSMVAVIRNTSQLSSEDRMAMAVYLKSLPIVEGAPRPEKK
jgi:mono/diheme cytochrome c family protein